MPQRLAGGARPPLRACVLIRIGTGAHVHVANIALHFGGSPRVTALLPVIPRRGQLQLRRKILGQAGHAALLQRVPVRLHPILGGCRGGEIPPAVSLLGRGRDIVRVLLRLLAGLVGRLDHGGGVVHRRIGHLVVRVGRTPARTLAWAHYPLRNRLSRQVLLLLARVLLHQLRGDLPLPPVVRVVQVAQAGGAQHPLRLRARPAIAGFGRALVAGQALQSRLMTPSDGLLVFGAALGCRLEAR